MYSINSSSTDGTIGEYPEKDKKKTLLELELSPLLWRMCVESVRKKREGERDEARLDTATSVQL